MNKGDRLYGFCNGFFGQSYGTKTVEAVGPDWIVVRTELGEPRFASFWGWEDRMQSLLATWAEEHCSCPARFDGKGAT